ncbi:hypothetical protein PYW08_004410 [Mythimna loreyi]|uniref:Uncharacterized protein n=1 Tax=Mythimna loreyi TaxID=667449 RepID=A0ACC2QP02_9NEOP|nr:hypothetical protein PYW08_004410 [Mythimna loreyi]
MKKCLKFQISKVCEPPWKQLELETVLLKTKMKAMVIFLIVGLVSVFGNPVLKPEDLSNEPLKNDNQTPVSDTSELEVKIELEDTTINKNDPEPIKVEVIREEILPAPDTSGDSTNFGDGEVDIVIEESVSPLEVISDEQNEINIDDDDYLYPGNQLIDSILADRIKEEIMETAAGFAPPPFLKKRRKQPARRRFAIRRRYQSYPYAPYRRLPYYNPYYRFYRPSSLRFY